MDWYYYVLIIIGVIVLFGILPLVIVAKFVFKQIFTRSNKEKDYVDLKEFPSHLKPYEDFIKNNYGYILYILTLIIGVLLINIRFS